MNLTDSLQPDEDFKPPEWCTLPLEDHLNPEKQCNGLMAGDVKEQGISYCKICQFNKEVNKDDSE